MSTEQIWTDYSEQILKYFIHRVHSHFIAQDLRQEVFEKVHKHISSLNQENKLQNWLSVISRNILTDYWKKEGRNDNFSFQEPTEEDKVTEMAAMICVDCTIDTLPEMYGKPLHMSDIEGTDQKVIAEKLGISLSGAKSRIQRGRKMLKNAITECCIIELNKRNELVDASCNDSECFTCN